MAQTEPPPSVPPNNGTAGFASVCGGTGGIGGADSCYSCVTRPGQGQCGWCVASQQCADALTDIGAPALSGSCDPASAFATATFSCEDECFKIADCGTCGQSEIGCVWCDGKCHTIGMETCTTRGGDPCNSGQGSTPSLSGGALIGTLIGCIVGTAILTVLAYRCWNARSRSEEPLLVQH